MLKLVLTFRFRERGKKDKRNEQNVILFIIHQNCRLLLKVSHVDSTTIGTLAASAYFILGILLKQVELRDMKCNFHI